MASRFWVGGSGTWDTSSTTHWSASSGGSGGASVPTISDSVTFNSSSGGGTISVNTTGTGDAAKCASFSSSGFTGTFHFTFSPVTSSPIEVRGSITLGASETWEGSSSNGGLSFAATSGGPYTFTSNGNTGTYLEINASAGITLQLGDDYLASSDRLKLTSGTLDANNHNVAINDFSSNNSNTRALIMGSGTWSIAGINTVWDIATSTNLTLTKGTSTIKLTDTSAISKTFNGGGLSYYNIWTVGGSSAFFNINQSNTFADFRVGGYPCTVKFGDGTTTTVASMTVSGILGSLVTLRSVTPSTAWNLNCTAGTISVDYCSIADSHAAGGASFRAVHSTDAGGNTGWTFSGNSGQMLMML